MKIRNPKVEIRKLREKTRFLVVRVAMRLLNMERAYGRGENARSETGNSEIEKENTISGG